MLKLEKLSEYHSTVIRSLAHNQRLCKYLYYADDKPQTNPDLVMPALDLLNSHIFPYPPDASIGDDEKIQLRVYFDGFSINNNTTDRAKLRFGLVIAKSKDIWLIEEDGLGKTRPIEIMFEIFNQFYDKDIGGSKLNFSGARTTFANDKFVVITMDAEILTITSGKR